MALRVLLALPDEVAAFQVTATHSILIHNDHLHSTPECTLSITSTSPYPPTRVGGVDRTMYIEEVTLSNVVASFGLKFHKSMTMMPSSDVNNSGIMEKALRRQ